MIVNTYLFSKTNYCIWAFGLIKMILYLEVFANTQVSLDLTSKPVVAIEHYMKRHKNL